MPEKFARISMKFVKLNRLGMMYSQKLEVSFRSLNTR